MSGPRNVVRRRNPLTPGASPAAYSIVTPSVFAVVRSKRIAVGRGAILGTPTNLISAGQPVILPKIRLGRSRPLSLAFGVKRLTPTFMAVLGNLSPLDLLEAVVAYLQSQAVLNAAFGSTTWLWDEGPVGDSFPLATVTTVSEIPSYFASDDGLSAAEEIDRNHLRLVVYSLGSKQQSILLANTIRRLLNDAPLTFQLGQLLMIRCISRTVSRMDDEPGPNGQNVWSSALTFVADVDRAVPY